MDKIPPGFAMRNSLQLVEKIQVGPLFKYGAVEDILKEMNILRKIYIRFYRAQVEIVCLKGVREFEIKLAAYFLAYLEGAFFVNIPSPSDNSRLVHILNLKQTDMMQIKKTIMLHLNQVAFPAHFLIQCKSHLLNNPVLTVANKHTIGRMTSAVGLL